MADIIKDWFICKFENHPGCTDTDILGNPYCAGCRYNGCEYCQRKGVFCDKCTRGNYREELQ